MAKGEPDIGDGFTRFANELLEALVSQDLSKNELKVVLLVGRMTYGWGRRWYSTTYADVARKTGTMKQAIGRACLSLEAKGVIHLERLSVGNRGVRMRIQTRWKQWRVNKKMTTAQLPLASTKKPESVNDSMTPIRNKETIKKGKRSPPVIPPFEQFWKTYPQGRRRDKIKCKRHWERKQLDRLAIEIIEDVKKRKQIDADWLEGFEPMPFTYLNNERWTSDIAKPKRRNRNKGEDVREKAIDYLTNLEAEL